MKTLTLKEAATKAAEASVRVRKQNRIDAEKYRSIAAEMEVIRKIAAERKMTPAEVLQKLLKAIYEN